MVLETKRLDMYIQWILEAITSIETYTKGMSFEKFEKDQKTLDAVLMQLIHI